MGMEQNHPVVAYCYEIRDVSPKLKTKKLFKRAFGGKTGQNQRRNRHGKK